LAGDLYVIAYNEGSAAWQEGARVIVLPGATGGGESPPVLTVSQVQRGSRGRLVLRFREVRSREEAELLVGTEVAVDSASLDPPGEGEFYFHEMPGWTVVTTGGEPVGVVVSVVALEQDLFEVRPTGGGATFYLPAIRDVVKTLDRAGRRVVIEPLEGLLP
jgi:16S rRNA processing protein RimM